MITLYHSPTARSIRIIWLLEELGIEYNQLTIDYYSAERVSAPFTDTNPVGTIPALTDGDLVFTESGAMINYIIKTYGDGRFAYQGAKEAAMVDEWMYWSEGLFAVHQRVFWDHCTPPPACVIDPVPSVGMEGMRQAIKYSALLERALRDDGYVVGDQLSGADFMLSFPLYFGNLSGFFETRPKIGAYCERVGKLPCFKTAIADTEALLADWVTNPPELASYRVLESEEFIANL